MTRCDKQGCYAPVVKNGSGLCYFHYNQQQRLLPECQSGKSPFCKGHVSRKRADLGHTICSDCENLAVMLEKQECKEQEFQDATTVEELKAWMVKYLLT